MTENQRLFCHCIWIYLLQSQLLFVNVWPKFSIDNKNCKIDFVD